VTAVKQKSPATTSLSGVRTVVILRNKSPKISQANVLKDSEPSALGVLLSPFIFSAPSLFGDTAGGCHRCPWWQQREFILGR